LIRAQSKNAPRAWKVRAYFWWPGASAELPALPVWPGELSVCPGAVETPPPGVRPLELDWPVVLAFALGVCEDPLDPAFPLDPDWPGALPFWPGASAELPGSPC
jgi:hypothetical protein